MESFLRRGFIIVPRGTTCMMFFQPPGIQVFNEIKLYAMKQSKNSISKEFLTVRLFCFFKLSLDQELQEISLRMLSNHDGHF